LTLSENQSFVVELLSSWFEEDCLMKGKQIDLLNLLNWSVLYFECVADSEMLCLQSLVTES
jgi:hypothetical protein